MMPEGSEVRERAQGRGGVGGGPDGADDGDRVGTGGANPADAPLFAWRQRFHDACADFAVDPAAACVRFGAAVPGVVATALNTSHPQRVAGNVALADAAIPAAFWRRLQDDGLVRRDLPWLSC